MEDGCSGFCDWLSRLMSQPFAGCMCFTMFFNVIPLAIMGYFLGTGWTNTCSRPLEIWLLVTMILFLLNTMFGCYIFRRLSGEGVDARGDWYVEGASETKNAANRAKHFFMYDPVVCLYIVLSIFSLVWTIMGLIWTGDSQDCVSTSGALVDAARAGAYCMLIFLIVGSFFIWCNLLSGYFNDCLNDCDFCKCCCCCIYYPCCYKPKKAQQNNGAGSGQQHQQHQQQQHQQYQQPGATAPYSSKPAHVSVPVAKPVAVAKPVQETPAYPEPAPVYHAPLPTAQPVSPPQYSAPTPQQQQQQQQQGVYGAPPAGYNAPAAASGKPDTITGKIGTQFNSLFASK